MGIYFTLQHIHIGLSYQQDITLVATFPVSVERVDSRQISLAQFNVLQDARSHKVCVGIFMTNPDDL
jgi:hypothetical protein